MMRATVYLSFLAALGVISSTLCANALPHIADHFQARFLTAQFTISLFFIGSAFGQMATGVLSDRWGQRRVLSAGLLLFVVASLACAMADSMALLIGFRMLQGMGSAAGPVMARAIAATISEERRSAQVQSYNAIGIGLASISAIIAGGFLVAISWRLAFVLAALIGGALFCFAFAALKADPLPQIGRPWLFGARRVWGNRPFLVHTAIHSLTYGLMYGYISLFSRFLKELWPAVTSGEIALYSGLMIVCYMVGAWVSSQGVLRFGVHRLVYSGVMIQLCGGVLLIAVPYPFVGLVFFNFALGLILPMTSAGALAAFRSEGAGTASALLGLSYRIGGSVLCSAICYAAVQHYFGFGPWMIAFSAASLLLLFAVERTPHRAGNQV
ncbi:MAG: hypothetical protein RL235_388 [Chlamydiota bacterium]|jgi:DHA1 family bicyclomycin/chloramphenicol resistance-like MFS transporter